MTTAKRRVPSTGPAAIAIAVDADGTGAGGFTPTQTVTTVNVGFFDLIAAQPNNGITPRAMLAYEYNGEPLAPEADAIRRKFGQNSVSAITTSFGRSARTYGWMQNPKSSGK